MNKNRFNTRYLAVSTMLVVIFFILPKQVSAQQSEVSYQIFYDQLGPYGQWINNPNYGYVWIPDAGSDFVPYSTGGHWILTEYGWTWFSDYNWGWVAFHYGRWNYDISYGWYWVPDNEWGPSWVIWRMSAGYYGWTPMEPDVSINISFNKTDISHSDHWIFVRDRDIEKSDINHYYINKTDRDFIIKKSVVIHNTYIDESRHTTYVSGPSRNDVQKITGKNIKLIEISDDNKPEQTLNNGKLQIYRPLLKKNDNREKKPVSSNVNNLKDENQKQDNKMNKQQNVLKPGNRNNAETQKKPDQPDNNIKKENPNTNEKSKINNKEQPVQQKKPDSSDKNNKGKRSNIVEQPQNRENNKEQPSKKNKSNLHDNENKK
jgi:hypothetical protein